jgi:hypothetical protein
MDWLFATKIGYNSSDFDYRYWPLSRLRWIGIAALMTAAIYMWVVTGLNGPLWLLIPPGVLFVSYIATVFADLSAQRRIGYKKPVAPRYSDSEYGS